LNTTFATPFEKTFFKTLSNQALLIERRQKKRPDKKIAKKLAY